MNKLTLRFWTEVTLAGSSALLGVMTMVWKEWIEILFHIDPDGGSGSLEVAISAGCLLAAVTFLILARIEWRRLYATA